VGLDAYIGRELALPPCGAVIADRTAKIFVARAVRRLGRCVTRDGDGARVEQTGVVRRSNGGTYDALQMDLHCLRAEVFGGFDE